MHNIAATTNFVSALFIVIIIFGIYITIKEPTTKTKYYRNCLWICLFALIVDGLSYSFDGRQTNNVVLWIFNYLSYISIDFLLVCYFLYLKSMVSEKECIFKKWFCYYIYGLCALDFIGLNVGAFAGFLFKVENGTLITGPQANYIVVVPLIWIVSILIVLIKRIKKIGVGTV